MAGCQPPHGGAPVPPVRMVTRKNELADRDVASQGFPLPGGVRAPSAARGYPPLPKRTTGYRRARASDPPTFHSGSRPFATISHRGAEMDVMNESVSEKPTASVQFRSPKPEA